MSDTTLGARGLFFRSETAIDVNRSFATKKYPSDTQGRVIPNLKEQNCC